VGFIFRVVIKCDMGKTFEELGKGGLMVYGEDKFGQHYTSIYDILFKSLQGQPVNLLEIGFYHGGSARLWYDYFGPNLTLRSIDCNPHCDIIGSWMSTIYSNFKLSIMDSNELTPDYFKDFSPDIVIDDGSHVLSDQLYIVNLVYPLLKPGAYLIIEDIFDYDNVKASFEKLGFPFITADLRDPNRSDTDSVLIIYKKV
jgi:hypothetical protein